MSTPVLVNSAETLFGSLQSVWYGLGGFLPKLALAIAVIAVGFLIGWLAKHAIEELFKALHIDRALSHTGLSDVMKRTGYKLNSGKFIGEIIRWFFIIVFTIFAFDFLNLQTINAFLNKIAVDFLPSLIVAILIIFIGSLLAEFLAKAVKGSVKAIAHTKNGHMIGTVVRWVVWIFTLLIAIQQIGIETQYLQIFFSAIAWSLAAGIGLAFGLGGKDLAARILNKVTHATKEDHHHDEKDV